MIRMIAVIATAAVAAFAAFKVAQEFAYDRAADLSVVNLNAVIDGKPPVADHAAWYAEPVTAALVVGAIVLVIGFMLATAAGHDKAPER